MAKIIKIGNKQYRIVFTNPHSQLYCQQYGRIEERYLLFGIIPKSRWYKRTLAKPYDALIGELKTLKMDYEKSKIPPEPLLFLDIPESLNS